MPLSEDEERILEEIESHFYESDPDLAHEVSKTTVYTHPLRHLKWTILGLLIGLVVMVTTFANFLPAAFGGFLIALTSLVLFTRSLRDLGRVGRGQLIQAMRQKGLRGVLGDTVSRMKDRYDRDESSED